MVNTLLELRDLSLTLGKTQVLRGVSFSLCSGDSLLIAGSNGSGKTTLLKSILGLLEPDSGTIFLNARALSEYSRKELGREVGYVPQTISPNLTRSLYDLVFSGRFAHINDWGVPSDEDHRIVTAALEATGLQKLSERYLFELSGGEFKRGLIAAALAQEPELLLLDEPFSGLDPKYQLEVNQTLQSLRADSGISTVLVSHDLSIMPGLAERVIGLKAGEICFDGKMDQFLDSEVLHDLYDANFSIITDTENKRRYIALR